VVLGIKIDIISVHGPPDAQPSVVLLLAVVGLADVLQTMPLTEIVAPPFETIVPPPTAEFEVMLVAGLVVLHVGTVGGAVTVTVALVEAVIVVPSGLFPDTLTFTPPDAVVLKTV
jgi:hypothetical protein